MPPEKGYDENLLLEEVRRKAKMPSADVRIMRRSIDARRSPVKVNIAAEAFLNEPLPELISYHTNFPDVSSAPEVIIVGAGPAGMFAALRLIELGLRPVIIERGKDVRARRRDLAAINKEHKVNPDSNYCFGEGGAGTYSDGKLYTRSKKRGDVQRILEILVAHGATEEILFEAHPHIGTNKLPQIVTNIRESILRAGGEIMFDTRVTGFLQDSSGMKGVRLADGGKRDGISVLLATGHSARDIFQLLVNSSIPVELKPFALGVRIEHPQALIDEIQYHCTGPRNEHLPASSYSLVYQARHQGIAKGVFSFCMCPGGFIVPAATHEGEVVVNGMSPSRRNSRFANSGIVVAVDAADFVDYEQYAELAGMHYQAAVEQRACQVAGGTQTAPAQRMTDFMKRRVSATLPDTSYQPGLMSVDLHEVLPVPVAARLEQGLRHFGKIMKGYLTNEAQLVGVESRTSSPVQIPRDKTTLEHVAVPRLFPCGEGAGYAGGIVSAAMDGERCAEAIHQLYARKK
nr:FAD-dependent monooxygenase [Fulvivirga sedimenti]